MCGVFITCDIEGNSELNLWITSVLWVSCNPGIYLWNKSEFRSRRIVVSACLWSVTAM
jgi:hypothetical protein